MSQQSTGKRSNVYTSLLWLIMLLGAVLRFFRIGHQSLWADEGNSIALAGRSLAEIAANAAADIHPPLYYWLLSIWTQIFGTSEVATRALSAVAGIVLIWIVYLIGSRLHDRRTGLIAALFAAVNPLLIAYSQEVRMYALLALEAALLYYGLVRFILHESVVLPADGTGKKISFAAPATAMVVGSSIAGLYTHYTFPLILATVTLLYLLWVYDSRRRGFVQIRLLHWGMLLIVIAFTFVPWMSTAVDQLTNWPRSGQATGVGEAISTMLVWLALGPAAQIEWSSPWFTIFVVLLFLGLWPWVRPGRRRAHWLSWLLPFLWLAGPMVLMLVGGLFKPAYLKFLIVGAAPFCLLMARGVTGFMESLERVGTKRRAKGSKGEERRGKREAEGGEPQAASSVQPVGFWLSRAWVLLAVLLLLIPTALTLYAYYFDPAEARDDYRGMAAYIEAVAEPADAIILNAPGQQEAFRYYYQGELPIYPLPRERPPDSAALQDELSQIAGQHRRLYGLFWATDESDPNGLVEGWLDTHAYKATDSWVGNVRFVTYATQQPAASWPVREVEADLGDQVRLQSYALSAPSIEAGDILQLQLIWEALRRPDGDYTVFVQLLDARNQVVAQRDAPPVSGGRPTSGWQPGEQVIDNHGLLVVPGTAPGDYRLILGLYDSETGQRLMTGAADYVDLGTIRVERPGTPPAAAALNMQQPRSYTFEEVTLLGHDRYKRGFRHAPDTPLRRNDLLHLTFYWRADVDPTAAWWFTARLVQGADKEVASVSGPLVSDLYPTLNWEQGEVVRGEHDLSLPDYLQPGRYQLQLFLHTGSNPEAVIDRVNLGTVVISEE